MRHLTLVIALLLAVVAPAQAADYVIQPGSADPPGVPVGRTGISWSQLQGPWGPPVACERNPENCASSRRDFASYPWGITVAKAARVRYFEATTRRWRTPEGARMGTRAARLKQIYGRRLVGVINRGRFAGTGSGSGKLDVINYMYTKGRNAVGFSMSNGRVGTILTGSTAEVTQVLKRYGAV